MREVRCRRKRVAALASPSSAAKTWSYEPPRRQAAPRRQSSDPRCASTYPHNEALIVSSTHAPPNWRFYRSLRSLLTFTAPSWQSPTSPASTLRSSLPPQRAAPGATHGHDSTHFTSSEVLPSDRLTIAQRAMAIHRTFLQVQPLQGLLPRPRYRDSSIRRISRCREAFLP